MPTFTLEYAPEAERLGWERVIASKAEMKRLGLTADTRLTVLGDGAEWIWNLAADRFPGAAGVLDVYHAIERIAGAEKAERRLAAAIAGRPEGVPTGPLLGLAAYLAKHPTRLDYAGRRRAGASAAGRWRGRSSSWSTCA